MRGIPYRTAAGALPAGPHERGEVTRLKRNRIFPVALALLMLAAFAGVSYAGGGKGTDAEFTGRVIYLGENHVELKRGPKELRLAYTDATRIFDISGAEADRSAIELCQTVRAVYRSAGGARELLSLSVVGEGNCRK